ncbi:BED zinc finger,hAT family dimerization domain [Canna indica]|uniref:BED zinc finger,hAT family dimerization domain n=1 Tax=Canna indica TaxID=4628 RepID=A0AAQ3QJ47_9LILI|nr:BED zinc finger,hAT family dimerization domain [Canna indica]
MVDDVHENLHDFLESPGDVIVKFEINQYLDDGRLPLTRDFDILSWWKSNGLKYPTLQRIAQDFIVIPNSTVASEAAFCTSGRAFSSLEVAKHGALQLHVTYPSKSNVAIRSHMSSSIT